MDLRLRPLVRPDFGLLAEWLAAPHVARWWQEDPDPEAIEARYGAAVDGADPTEVFVIEADGEPIGLIQRYRIDDNPDWRQVLAPIEPPSPAVGIDYLIGRADRTGQGIGTAVIRQLVEGSWALDPPVAAVVVAVQQENRRSWRALERSGLRRLWAGMLDSDDPSDAGPAFVYVAARPTGERNLAAGTT